jgi:hypothetical protein
MTLVGSPPEIETPLLSLQMTGCTAAERKQEKMLTKKMYKPFVMGSKAGAEFERERIMNLVWGWAKANKNVSQDQWEQLTELIIETAPEKKKRKK